MSIPEKVFAKAFDGWSASLHPGGPKFTIVCGKCGGVFRHRIPTSFGYPAVPCSCCGTLNIIQVVPDGGGI